MCEQALYDIAPQVTKKSTKFTSHWGSLLDYMDMSVTDNLSTLVCTLPRESPRQPPSPHKNNRTLSLGGKFINSRTRYGRLHNAIQRFPKIRNSFNKSLQENKPALAKVDCKLKQSQYKESAKNILENKPNPLRKAMYTLQNVDYVAGFTEKSILGVYKRICQEFMNKEHSKRVKKEAFPMAKVAEQSRGYSLKADRAESALRKAELEQWLELNKHMKEMREEKAVLEFAKHMFQVWDLEGSGYVSADKIIEELIELGMDQDHRFVVSLVKDLQERSKGEKVSMEDFIEFVKCNQSFIRASDKLKEEKRTKGSRRVLKNFEKILRPYPPAGSLSKEDLPRRRHEMAKSVEIPSQQGRVNEEIDAVSRWWKEVEVMAGCKESIPLEKVSDFLIRKGVVRNKYKARQMLKLGQGNNQIVEYEDFKKLFYKGILHDTIQEVYAHINVRTTEKNVPEFLKISGYKKSLLLKEGDPKNPVSMRNARIIQSLRRHRTNRRPSVREIGVTASVALDKSLDSGYPSQNLSLINVKL